MCGGGGGGDGVSEGREVCGVGGGREVMGAYIHA